MKKKFEINRRRTLKLEVSESENANFFRLCSFVPSHSAFVCNAVCVHLLLLIGFFEIENLFYRLLRVDSIHDLAGAGCMHKRLRIVHSNFIRWDCVIRRWVCVSFPLRHTPNRNRKLKLCCFVVSCRKEMENVYLLCQLYAQPGDWSIFICLVFSDFSRFHVSNARRWQIDA